MTSRKKNQIFEIDCDMMWYRQIVEGKKTIEVRPAKQKYLNLHSNQIIKINAVVNGNVVDVCTYVRVVRVKKYSSFNEMIEACGLKNVLPGVENVKDAENVYRKWHCEKLEKELGVVGIEIDNIK